MASSIALCSSALAKLGAEGISSLDDGTAEARIASRLYPITRDGLLSVYPWSFATKTARLTSLKHEPVSDFEFAFSLPSDFLRALSTGQGGRSRGAEFQIIGRRLHTNAASATLSYIYRPSEGDFPPYFVSALVTRLAAEFCIPLTENSERAERLAAQAEGELSAARLADSQQDTPPRFEDFSLIRSRFS